VHAFYEVGSGFEVERLEDCPVAGALERDGDPASPLFIAARVADEEVFSPLSHISARWLCSPPIGLRVPDLQLSP
jgi:hypothetical protein